MNLDDLYPSDTKERAAFFSNFWSKVHIQGPDDCWEWKASRYEGGYGQASLIGTSRQERAHRIAYAWVKGDVPEGKGVLHSCDNPPCCNPAHLWVGTQADNNHDMFGKGRANPGRTRSLDDTLLLEVRRRYDEGDCTAVELAHQYGISRATLYRYLEVTRMSQNPPSLQTSET